MKNGMKFSAEQNKDKYEKRNNIGNECGTSVCRHRQCVLFDAVSCFGIVEDL